MDVCVFVVYKMSHVVCIMGHAVHSTSKMSS